MKNKRRTLEELNIMDDFLMTAVASNEEVGPEFCRRILSILLNRKIGKVRIITQKAISALTPELRGIRMDVEVVEEETVLEDGQSRCNVYDLEPHRRNDMDLPKHNRFYQARVDSRYLKSGESAFENLPNLYMISITSYDPFGLDYMMYTVKNHQRSTNTCYHLLTSLLHLLLLRNLLQLRMHR